MVDGLKRLCQKDLVTNNMIIKFEKIGFGSDSFALIFIHTDADDFSYDFNHNSLSQ